MERRSIISPAVDLASASCRAAASQGLTLVHVRAQLEQL